MRNLREMGFDQINNFLGALERNGIEKFWIERIQKDRDFGEGAVKAMMVYYFENLTRYTIGTVNPAMSRVQLNHALIGRKFSTIRDNLLTALYPKQNYDPELTPYELEILIFPIFYRATEEDILAILGAYGYESISVEEALTFALRFGLAQSTGDAIILSSKLIRESGKSEFLHFGCSNNIGLWTQRDGDGFGLSKFLIKKK
jgi:hypothetical protein